MGLSVSEKRLPGLEKAVKSTYSSSRGPISGGLQPSVSSVLEGITALAYIGICAYSNISICIHTPTCDYRLIQIKSSKRKLCSEFGGTCL